MLYLGPWGTLNTYITGATGVPSGSGCYVTEVKTLLAGVRSDKDEDGVVTATKDVSFDVSFLTARFETADQIAAFGGRNGILRSCYDRTMSLLMIGTVKNDLFAQCGRRIAVYDLYVDGGAFLGPQRRRSEVVVQRRLGLRYQRYVVIGFEGRGRCVQPLGSGVEMNKRMSNSKLDIPFLFSRAQNRLGSPMTRHRPLNLASWAGGGAV